MRISTAVLSTLVAAGSLSASMQYAIGQQAAAPGIALDVLPAADPTQVAPADTPAPSDTTAPAEAQPADAAPADLAATADPTATTTAQPSATTEPAPAASATPAETVAPPPDPVVLTATSDVIEYKYGVVQISLTTTDGKITNVTLLQGDTSYGRDAAYAALIDATIAAQGINYGNYSTATFTTDAFKKAVTNALGKL